MKTKGTFFSYPHTTLYCKKERIEEKDENFEKKILKNIPWILLNLKLFSNIFRTPEFYWPVFGMSIDQISGCPRSSRLKVKHFSSTKILFTNEIKVMKIKFLLIAYTSSTFIGAYRCPVFKIQPVLKPNTAAKALLTSSLFLKSWSLLWSFVTQLSNIFLGHKLPYFLKNVAGMLTESHASVCENFRG